MLVPISLIRGAFLCGLTFGAFKDMDDLRTRYKIGKVSKPSKNQAKALEHYAEWRALVDKLTNLDD